MNSKKYIALLPILLFCINANAQWVSEMLFYRMQLTEYQKLQNATRHITPRKDFTTVINTAIAFPLKCITTDHIVFKAWNNAEYFFQNLRWSEAAIGYEGCIRRDSLLCDPYFRLAQCYVAMNNYGAAYSIFRLAEKKFPTNPMVFLGLGQLYLMLDHPDEAVAIFEKMTSLDPDNTELLFGASFALNQIGEYQKALVSLEVGIKKFKENFDAANRPFNIPDAQRVSALWKKQSDYLYVYQGILYYRVNQTQRALDILRANASLEDSQVEGVRRYFMALCYQAKGRSYYAEAVSNLQRASKADIAIEPSLAKTIGFHINPADFKNLIATETYSERPACGTKNKVQKKLIKIAEELYENRLIEESIEEYKKLIQADSSNCDLYIKLIECHRTLLQSDELFKLSKLAALKFPGNIDIQLQFAQDLFLNDRLDETLTLYKSVINSAPADYRGYYGAALLLAHQQQPKEAIEIINLYRKQHSFLIPAQITSIEGILQYQLGFPHIALDKFKTIYLRDPVKSYYMALCYHSFGKSYSENAAAELNEALELGAMVDARTQEMIGLDPKLHPSFKQN